MNMEYTAEITVEMKSILEQGYNALWDDLHEHDGEMTVELAGYRDFGKYNPDALTRLSILRLIAVDDGDKEWRITKLGADTLKALENDTWLREREAALRSDGRVQLLKELHTEIGGGLANLIPGIDSDRHSITGMVTAIRDHINQLKSSLPWEGRIDEAKHTHAKLGLALKTLMPDMSVNSKDIGIEGMIEAFKEKVRVETNKANRFEGALRNKDRVLEHAAILVEMAGAEQMTHAERRGALQMVAAYLRRYIGHRTSLYEPPVDAPQKDEPPF